MTHIEIGVGSAARIEINFTDKRLEEKYGSPILGSSGAAAVDLRAVLTKTITLWPGDHAEISCGFRMSMPRGLAALIIPRSGQGWKGLNLMNTAGLIDSDYQGEIKAKLVHRGFNIDPIFTIRPYDRIAQMIFIHYYVPLFEPVAQFTRQTERGEGGFGSTGTK